jgi:hypothetical protein
MSKAQCLDCQDIIESKHRHDFVRCSCGNSFIDGGDDYLRASGKLVILDGEQRLSPMELFMNDTEPVHMLNRDEALQRLLEDIEIDDIFNDDSFLDDDFDDYNLGYQSGTLDERDRILQGIQKLEDQSNATRTPLYQDTMFDKIRKIVNGQA